MRAPLRSPLDIAGTFLDQAPVDLDAMARALGVIVLRNRAMDRTVSGLIRRSEPDQFIVEVNGNHSPNRQRFTIAHELAHYLLHRDQIGDGIQDDALYRSSLSSKTETEANDMAARILMPAGLVRRVYRAGLQHIAGLSRAFEVSEDAMRIRLERLGLGA